MKGRYFRYSIVLLFGVLLVFSFLILKFMRQGETHIQSQEIHEVVTAYFQALSAYDNEEAMKYREFHDELERREFLDRQRLVQHSPIRWAHTKEGPHLVHAEQMNGHIMAIYLLPRLRGYLPVIFFISNVEGRLKIAREKPERSRKPKRFRTADLIMKTQKAKFSDLLIEWENAEGAVLAEKAQAIKRKAQKRYLARKYADKHNLMLLWQLRNEDWEWTREKYYSVKDMTDAEIRLTAIEETSSTLERLPPPEPLTPWQEVIYALRTIRSVQRIYYVEHHTFADDILKLELTKDDLPNMRYISWEDFKVTFGDEKGFVAKWEGEIEGYRHTNMFIDAVGNIHRGAESDPTPKE